MIPFLNQSLMVISIKMGNVKMYLWLLENRRREEEEI
jgi:predicted DNA-binding transcriptional regulator